MGTRSLVSPGASHGMVNHGPEEENRTAGLPAALNSRWVRLNSLGVMLAACPELVPVEPSCAAVGADVEVQAALDGSKEAAAVVDEVVMAGSALASPLRANRRAPEASTTCIIASPSQREYMSKRSLECSLVGEMFGVHLVDAMHL